MTSTNLSLYIPRVFESFDKNYVASKFDNFGKVDRVDFVAKMGQDGNPYNAAYIHFDFWYTGADVENFANEVLSGKAHLYYDGPWYWIVLQNKGKKIEGGVRRPRIDLTESKAIIPDYEEMDADMEEIDAAMEEMEEMEAMSIEDERQRELTYLYGERDFLRAQVDKLTSELALMRALRVNYPN
jgi:hypothetical protein